MQLFFNRGFVLILLSVPWLILASCVTSDNDSKSGDGQALIENCYCGPLGNTEKVCSLWSASSRIDQSNPVIKSVKTSKCELSVCQQEFRSLCSNIQMWPHPITSVSQQTQEPCFCDLAWIEHNQEPVLVCAAWSPHSPWLLEYYQTELPCEPSSCQRPPFARAQKVCPNGFRSFYPSWEALASPETRENPH